MFVHSLIVTAVLHILSRWDYPSQGLYFCRMYPLEDLSSFNRICIVVSQEYLDNNFVLHSLNAG